MIELTNEINSNSLMYYFKGFTSMKKFDNFEIGIRLFEKLKSDEMEPEQAKKLQRT